MQKEKNILELFEELRDSFQSLRIMDAFDVAGHISRMGVGGVNEADRFRSIDEFALNFQEWVDNLSEGLHSHLDFLATDLQNILREMVDMEVSYRCQAPMGAYAVMQSQARKLPALGEVMRCLEQFVSREAMLYLDSRQTESQLRKAKEKLYKEWDDFRANLFGYVVTSLSWSKGKLLTFVGMALSPTVDSITSQLLVSAVTLACLNVYDSSKFEFLMTVAFKAQDQEVKQRAFIGMLLASTRMPKGVLAEDFKKRMEEACKQNPVLIGEIVNVQKMLALTLYSERSVHEYSNDMFSLMSSNMMKAFKHSMYEHFDSEILDALELGEEFDDDMDDDFADDYFFDGGGNGNESAEQFGKPRVNDSLKTLSDKGLDILLPQFKHRVAKNDAFFSEVYNWFMPFDENNPIVTKAMAKKTDYDLLTLFRTMAGSSAADAYSFALLALEESRDPLDEVVMDCFDTLDTGGVRGEGPSLGGETHNGDDGRSFGGLSECSVEEIRIRYLRNILRFFKLSIWRSDFFDIFEVKKGKLPGFAVLDSPLFQSPMFDAARLTVARFATRKQMPLVVKGMLDAHEPTDSLEKLYMEGWAASQSEEKGELFTAIGYFEQMLKEQPHLKSPCKGICECYEHLGDVDKYLESFDRLWKFSDEFTEEYKLQLKSEKLRILFEDGRIDDTIKLAYELEYNHTGQEYISAVLTYCLLKRNNSELGDFRKAEERLDDYFTDESQWKKIMTENDESLSAEEKGRNMVAASMGLLLKFAKKDKRADALNNYSRALVSIAKGDFQYAIDSFLKCHMHWRNNKGKNLRDYLIGDSAWLATYGFGLDELKMIYSGVQIIFMEKICNYKDDGDEQQQDE